MKDKETIILVMLILIFVAGIYRAVKVNEQFKELTKRANSLTVKQGQDRKQIDFLTERLAKVEKYANGLSDDLFNLYEEVQDLKK